MDKIMECNDMGCACGGGWIPKDGKTVCAWCGKLAPFQEMPNYRELLLKYNELLKLCWDLVEDEISLNEFKVIVSNLE